MNTEEHEKFMKLNAERQWQNDVAANQYRARSVTVGTAFGGAIEISMRRQDGTVVWGTLQPVEVVDLIHQLSATVGCNINVQPREDFASWRAWVCYTPEDLANNNGHVPPRKVSDKYATKGNMKPRSEA